MFLQFKKQILKYLQRKEFKRRKSETEHEKEKLTNGDFESAGMYKRFWQRI